jgi:hypothetical protein
MKFHKKPEEDTQYIWNEASKKDRVSQKLLNYYKKKQREKKIKKLLANDEHWTGLS